MGQMSPFINQTQGKQLMIPKRALASLALTFFAIGCSQAESDGGALSNADISFVKGDAILGDENATVEIIEYASTTCGHCRTFQKTILPQIKSAFIETGKANLVYRDLPTAPANVAVAGGALARCAGADKYHDVLDAIFTDQYEIIQATRTGGALKELVRIGGDHGLSEEQVKACVSNAKVIAEITRTADLATEDGVNSTPTLFINGDRVETQDMNVDGITRIINAKLGVETPAEPAE